MLRIIWIPKIHYNNQAYYEIKNKPMFKFHIIDVEFAWLIVVADKIRQSRWFNALT